MVGTIRDGRPGSPAAALAMAVALAIAPGAARAGDGASSPGLWDSLLEKLDVKAAPAAPAPDFVRRSRQDTTDAGYIQPAVPHKVSPLVVKTPAQIQAKKDALDAAKLRQLQPGAHTPTDLAKATRPPADRPAQAVAD